MTLTISSKNICNFKCDVIIYLRDEIITTYKVAINERDAMSSFLFCVSC